MRFKQTFAAILCGWVMGTSGALPAVSPQSPQSPASPAVSTDSPLDRFLRDLKTFRADFTQTVVDSRGAHLEPTRGTLTVIRPGKFRWEVAPDAKGSGAQLLIADGRNVWFYDRDLEQVTVKPVDAALSATPAMLLSGGDVRSAFRLTDAGKREGRLWTHVEPVRADADFRGALLGFSTDGALERMIVEDKLGQTATIDFNNSVRNAPIDESLMRFTPPKGVDVIGKPAQ
jgi:outer membrane lipoprotein carrier protein